MNNSTICSSLGPCGLYCGQCFANENGAIRLHALALQKALGEFDNYARRFTTLLNDPRFENYPAFKEVLDLLTEGKCMGCRFQSCKLFEQCGVKECARQKMVDFCFQCKEFPCEDHGFDENLAGRWLAINKRIGTIGLQNYFDEIKDNPRY
ncbi:MAG TPA: hypothetical protein DCR43_08480 [Bacteroidales bacterium]|nr:MAG: hypothetical protein A2X11_02865 [Bacteroidetes bacterium GWE2_42_24]OFY28832.1 MAG: hypothetical protein A2X09_12270 [Bacteroidetes bacterium GWF2_43_11]HAQ65869.1 hypothetical protein [Bacteroidales bacterium]HBZ67663.1 hypothetical protein [Bacteroidales bacterium]